jgi:hypothetical protein
LPSSPVFLSSGRAAMKASLLVAPSSSATGSAAWSFGLSTAKRRLRFRSTTFSSFRLSSALIARPNCASRGGTGSPAVVARAESAPSNVFSGAVPP